MKREDMRKYKNTTEVTFAECYLGNKQCASCMHAFPGNHALDMMDTDCDGTEKDVCRMCKK